MHCFTFFLFPFAYPPRLFFYNTLRSYCKVVKETFPISVFKESVKLRLFSPTASITTFESASLLFAPAVSNILQNHQTVILPPTVYRRHALGRNYALYSCCFLPCSFTLLFSIYIQSSRCHCFHLENLLFFHVAKYNFAYLFISFQNYKFLCRIIFSTLHVIFLQIRRSPWNKIVKRRLSTTCLSPRREILFFRRFEFAFVCFGERAEERAMLLNFSDSQKRRMALSDLGSTYIFE